MMRNRSTISSIAIALVIPLSAAGLSLVGSRASANPPWWPSFSVKNVEADPNKAYSVTDSNGPWMIMVTTFRGQGAEQQAHQLVVELRKQYKRNAYVHKRPYDYTERGMAGIGIDPEGRPKRMQYANEEKGDEVAVLMGDYRSIDDPEGQKDLAMLKRAEPECLKTPSSQPAENSFAALKRKSQELWGGYASKGNGPLASAIMTTNPLLPKEFFAAKQGVDKFVLDLNKGINYSLLDCPGHYSVKIATFTGKVVIDQRKITEIERGKDARDKADDADPLVMATKKAHALTEELRKKGVEAYEFHDRYSSVVAVGSFNAVGTPRPDGKTEINPTIYDLMRKYGSDPNASHSDTGLIGMGQKSVQVTLDGKRKPVLLDVQPVPIEVPRRSISSDFQQASFFR
jgi:hypothetical protein